MIFKSGESAVTGAPWRIFEVKYCRLTGGEPLWREWRRAEVKQGANEVREAVHIGKGTRPKWAEAGTTLRVLAMAANAGIKLKFLDSQGGGKKKDVK